MYEICFTLIGICLISIVLFLFMIRIALSILFILMNILLDGIAKSWLRTE